MHTESPHAENDGAIRISMHDRLQFPSFSTWGDSFNYKNLTGCAWYYREVCLLILPCSSLKRESRGGISYRECSARRVRLWSFSPGMRELSVTKRRIF